MNILTRLLLIPPLTVMAVVVVTGLLDVDIWIKIISRLILVSVVIGVLALFLARLLFYR